MFGNQKLEINGVGLDETFWEGQEPVRYRKVAEVLAVPIPVAGVVHTPEGDMEFSPGDYIVSDDPVTHAWPVRKQVFLDTHAVHDGGYLISSKSAVSVAPEPSGEPVAAGPLPVIETRDLRIPVDQPVEMVNITGMVDEVLKELGLKNGLATRIDPVETMGMAIASAHSLAVAHGKTSRWVPCALPKHEGSQYVHEHGSVWYLPAVARQDVSRLGMTRDPNWPKDETLYLPRGAGEYGELGFNAPGD